MNTCKLLVISDYIEEPDRVTAIKIHSIEAVTKGKNVDDVWYIHISKFARDKSYFIDVESEEIADKILTDFIRACQLQETKPYDQEI